MTGGAPGIRLFAEHTRRQHRGYRPDGTVEVETTRTLGACVDLHEGPGDVRHRFADGDDLLRDPPVPLPAAVVEQARAVQAGPAFELGEEDDRALRDLARATGAGLGWACYHQQVLAGGPDGVTADRRLAATLEVSLPGAGPEVVPWRAGGVAAAEAACARALARAALPPVDLPPGGDLVLPPGRAGAFFHELVGHPMEADVLASGTSYLGGLAGRAVAPDWLTITDGAVGARHGYRAAIDDEGTPTREVTLIDRGVVGEPMSDRATAALLGRPPSGHGRRLDYRHPAIPRMTHTRARTAPGTPAETPDGPFIVPFGLRIEAMNIATGHFVFSVGAPVLHDAAGPVGRLPAFDLRGHAPRVLAGLRPAVGDQAEYFRASRGCGKLGQFPLVVSFANGGLLLPRDLVTVEVTGGDRDG
ncbi:peptidase C69 [Actinomadura craniellae]|uniref:Peptidase C69 n=1 Tax=Actinomadura craniellae TaxID=2231787 RepID=A0A365HAU5_9ACTN|nr:metallopeptidase TldD-related protein [Actinomadura craniellae]RAY16149.1 peptidase C69 [Actinomadura craniellae]